MTVQIQARVGFWHAGRVICPGETVAMSAADAFDACACLRATPVDPVAFAAAMRAENHAVAALLKRNRPMAMVSGTWPPR